ncbi:chemosensory receptor A [Elysia marginata]|uniref:Chemosensory receptor A n=1 Tax=Elysia marginata TaxID=1093978 RepID=A0AAV4IIM3_9GAST|nr:chemosensory receptor A [Elysia marginata]
MSNDTASSQGIVPILSYYTYIIFGHVNGLGVICAFALFGVFSNIANIIVYVKMGLSETVNISLLTLSVSDLIASLSMLFLQIFVNPLVAPTRLPSGAFIEEIGYTTTCLLYPFLGLGACVTAILSIERCLCVITPLKGQRSLGMHYQGFERKLKDRILDAQKIKSIVTPSRISVLLGVFFIYEAVLCTLMLVQTGPPYKSYNYKRLVYMAWSFTYPSTVCFVLISATTVFLVVRLRTHVSWRNQTTNQASGGSVKELKATRFVILICLMFITCFSPNVAVSVVTLVYQEFTLQNPYFRWLVHVTFSSKLTFQTVSISTNALVYYSMSTKYREVFREIFFKKRPTVRLSPYKTATE